MHITSHVSATTTLCARRIVQHLRDEAKGCDYLVLWLDCDLEGENICFEVIECCVPRLNRMSKQQQVFRAKFSSISKPDIKKAMNNLVAPNVSRC